MNRSELVRLVARFAVNADRNSATHLALWVIWPTKRATSVVNIQQLAA